MPGEQRSQAQELPREVNELQAVSRPGRGPQVEQHHREVEVQVAHLAEALERSLSEPPIEARHHVHRACKEKAGACEQHWSPKATSRHVLGVADFLELHEQEWAKVEDSQGTESTVQFRAPVGDVEALILPLRDLREEGVHSSS